MSFQTKQEIVVCSVAKCSIALTDVANLQMLIHRIYPAPMIDQQSPHANERSSIYLML